MQSANSLCELRALTMFLGMIRLLDTNSTMSGLKVPSISERKHMNVPRYLSFHPYRTRFYSFCDRSMREQAWRSRKRASRMLAESQAFEHMHTLCGEGRNLQYATVTDASPQHLQICSMKCLQR